MSNEFPKMLYKHGGPHEIHGGKFSYRIVEDEADLSVATGEGWHATTDAARAAGKPAPKVEAPEPDDDAPPTRAELEAKARELGLDFDGRTGDKKLAARIAAALKA